MRRPSVSVSASGASIPVCQPTDARGPTSASNPNACKREFQSMFNVLDDEDCIEESCPIGEKKRRLSIEQVKALEKSFEVENKLEPERKATLARDLGLQPRQVAIWFQNRRARWKTKQLERDYGLLKTDHEALELKYDNLRRENEALAAEIVGLKLKLGEKKADVGCCDTREEIVQSHPDYRLVSEQSKMKNTSDEGQKHRDDGLSIVGDLKDGPSDSDSSAILSEENGPHGSMPSILRFDSGFSCYSSTNYLQFLDYSRASANTQKASNHMMKIEEVDLVNGVDEACKLFGEEQGPSLPWYCSEPWD